MMRRNSDPAFSKSVKGLLVPTLILALAAPLHTQQRGPAEPQASQPGPLRWEDMGPPSSGRSSAIAGIPGDPGAYDLGSASGGIWKTTDAGETFDPIFDEADVQAVGALAVDPSDPDVIWGGRGKRGPSETRTSWATGSRSPPTAGGTGGW
ncbi:MAG: hypothetical protein OEZ65_08460 [Gemmatimonadota bacterium]|nr:hypothetical protein [Gemmatimonadota bacterium]